MIFFKDFIFPKVRKKSNLARDVAIYLCRELSSRRRNRVFSYAGYLEIMKREMELPG